ncbi:JHBP domain containing protein [Asbolus verrucosus]|uniref:JHBP domain containing protein n=1 Tax=Asbolus verrucosus TaxID=1661398 RepID=A0A482VLM5_ASBVE|nr:JHBP domain containing protein [Asbolus verrucosus]
MHRAALCLLVATLSESVNFVPNFKKCDRRRPDLHECVLQTSRQVLPQLARPSFDLPNLDPLEIPQITIKSGGGSVAVDQTYRNCKMYGLLGVKIERFEFDFGAKTIAGAAFFPKVDVRCEYKMDGKILLLPVRGEGQATIRLENLKTGSFIRFKEIRKKGKTFLKFLTTELNIDPGHVSFDFENLFDGDKQLGDNFNQVLNDNWKEVFDDVKGNLIETFSQILLGMAGNFFGNFPLEELFDN